MFVGSFEPDDFFQFQTDVQDTFDEFKQAGLKQLIIDLSNNGGAYLDSQSSIEETQCPSSGGFVCLGHFLHAFLSGTKSLGSFQNP